MTAGVEGSVDPEEAALDNLRDRRPGVFGDGVPVPAVDQGVRGDTRPVDEEGYRILLSFADKLLAQMRPALT